LVRLKKETEAIMRTIPRIGDDLAEYARRSEESLKSFFTPGMLFEAFKFNYLGPIDGHDLKRLVRVFEQVRELEGPLLVHVLTRKGKGYEPAETNPSYFHGVGCFEPESGEVKKFIPCDFPSYTEVFGSTLCQLAEEEPSLVAITAAMPEGTGLSKFAERFPERFFDVGICEQHAVTFAAGLACEGFRPVVAIYSTFMQRSYDQVVHDVCLQNLPVTLCLDRAGLVGEDGATHHGAFDISYLRLIPNLLLMAPKDEAELQSMLATALRHQGPAAIRYPRGVGVGAALQDKAKPLTVGQGELLKEGGDALVVALGSRVNPSGEAIRTIEEEGRFTIALFNPRFVKPLPEEQILALVREHRRILLVEENALAGGFGSAVLELLAGHDLLGGKKIRRIGLPDRFVEHGRQKELRSLTGIDAQGICSKLREILDEETEAGS
ncbi:MAG: 1-deoxy-D-xylulose-5-phosphate synthase, partial [Desulfohalobiaceae bacterium]